MTEIRKVVTDRFEVLAKQLYEVDSRFTFFPRSGYIRFTNIVDGTPVQLFHLRESGPMRLRFLCFQKAMEALLHLMKEKIQRTRSGLNG